MTWAPTEVQKRIFYILNNDAALMTLLGSTAGANNRVFDSVPDNHPCPYITIQMKPTTDRGNEDYQGLTMKLYFHSWYDGPKEGDLTVQQIQSRIDKLLHDMTTIFLTGWNIISLQREMIDIRLDPDGRTRHGIQIFNLMIGES